MISIDGINKCSKSCSLAFFQYGLKITIAIIVCIEVVIFYVTIK